MAKLAFFVLISALLIVNGLTMSVAEQQQQPEEQQQQKSEPTPKQRVEDEFVDLIIEETNKYLDNKKKDEDDDNDLILKDLLLNSRDLGSQLSSKLFNKQHQQPKSGSSDDKLNIMGLLKSKVNNYKPNKLNRQQNLNEYMSRLLSHLNRAPVSANGDAKAMKRAACGNLNGSPMYKWMCW